MMSLDKLCKIRSLYREIERFEAEFESQFQICFNEGVMLCALSRCDSLTSTELAENLELSSSNASKVIALVEKKGFIKRYPCEKDRRVMHFRLTDSGRSKIEQIEQRNLKIPTILSSINLI